MKQAQDPLGGVKGDDAEVCKDATKRETGMFDALYSSKDAKQDDPRCCDMRRF